MATATPIPPATTPIDASPDRDTDGFRRLAALACKPPSQRAFYRAAIGIIGAHLKAPYAALQVHVGTTSIDECTEALPDAAVLWSRATQAMLLEAQMQEQAIARLYTVDATSTPVALLAVPLESASHGAAGAIALVAACDDKRAAESLLFELRSLAALVAAAAPTAITCTPSEKNPDQEAARALQKALEFHGVDELAFALTNSVKTKFGCDQVALGLVRGKTASVLSVSEMDELNQRSPGTNQIRQAMEECLDCRDTICMSSGAEQTNASVAADYRLHWQWAAAIGGATVASIPLFAGEACVAVVSFTRPKGVPFEEEELARISAAVRPYAAALPMLMRCNRSLVTHVADSARAAARWVMSPGRWKRQAMAACVLALGLWFCFGEMTYRISVPCTITATRLQCFSAPYHGAIAEAHVEPGDEVRQGQLLFKMDTTDLELKCGEFKSDASVLQLQAAQAVAAGDLDASAKATAALAVVQARLDLVKQQIRQAHVVAPCDGTIMSGEIAKRVGEVVPLGETLLTFAPRGAWRVELETPEDEILHVRSGLRGRFATLARPDDPVSLTIALVKPAAEAKGNGNVYIATADVDDNPEWMRAGMQGTAAIDAGNRKVWWIVLHRVINYLRYHFET